MATPITEINIINVPFNFTQQNVFSFDSLAQQNSYFLSKVVKSYSKNYVVKNNSIKIEERFENIKGNYLRYKNTNKWYYAFITEVKYINEYTSEIFFTVDAWQTFYFDFSVEKCFVEREHVTNDGIGVNTVSEPFNYPKHAITSGSVTKFYDRHYLAVTFTGDVAQADITEAERNDIRAGIITRIVGHNKGRATGGITKVYTIDQRGLSALLRDINKLSDKGANSITSMYEVPYTLVTETYDANLNGDGKDGVDINTLPTPFYKAQADSLATLQNKIGYTVRNKKLLSDQFFHWELLNNSGGSLETYPSETNYIAPDYHAMINYGQNIFAVCRVDNLSVGRETVHLTTSALDSVAWNGSNYAEYLATTENVRENRLIQSGFNTIAGTGLSLATGNVIGAVGSLGSGIAEVLNTQAREKDMQKTSSGLRGSQNSSGLASIYANKLVWWAYGLNRYDLERADLFLDRYGYQVNVFKKPNHNSRTSYNYIKTSECNLVGAIPSEYMAQLVNMYNNGFTIWHSQSFNKSLRTRSSGVIDQDDVPVFNNFMKYENNEIRREGE